MLDQEMASIMRYVLDASYVNTPYYDEVPEGFVVPSVFFPQPEIVTTGDTFDTFAVEYVLFAKFFHSSTPLAYDLGMAALLEIQRNRRLIPLVDESGTKTRRGIRINDPNLKGVDAAGVAQLELSWTVRRPYNRPPVEKMMIYHLDLQMKQAYRAAVAQLKKEENHE